MITKCAKSFSIKFFHSNVAITPPAITIEFDSFFKYSKISKKYLILKSKRQDTAKIVGLNSSILFFKISNQSRGSKFSSSKKVLKFQNLNLLFEFLHLYVLSLRIHTEVQMAEKDNSLLLLLSPYLKLQYLSVAFELKVF